MYVSMLHFQLCSGQVNQDLCPSVLGCCTLNPTSTPTTTTTSKMQECFVCEDGSLREHLILQLKVIMIWYDISKQWIFFCFRRLDDIESRINCNNFQNLQIYPTENFSGPWGLLRENLQGLYRTCHLRHRASHQIKWSWAWPALRNSSHSSTSPLRLQ